MNNLSLKYFTFFILICTLNFSFGQKLSTVFVDSIKVIYNNKTLYTNTTSKIIFLKNNQAHRITIYQNDSLKADLTLECWNYSSHKFKIGDKRTIDTSQTTYLISGHLNVIDKNGGEKLKYNIGNIDEKYCDFTYYKDVIRNWSISENEPEKKYSVEVSFRLTNSSPIDTLNYKYNNRNGVWVKSLMNGDWAEITYENDIKQGKAILHNKNGDYIIFEFENDKQKSQPLIFNKKGKEKAFGGYTLDKYLQDDCGKKVK
jgi:hypothetical protein